MQLGEPVWLISRVSLWDVGRLFLPPLRKRRQLFLLGWAAQNCVGQDQTGDKVCVLRPALGDAVRLVVMISLAVFSRGLSFIDTEHMTRPALHMSWWGMAWQIFLKVHEGTLQGCSQLAGPHSWASLQAETAAFQFLCLLLTIQLPFEHFWPGQMPSGIMTLKDPMSKA